MKSLLIFTFFSTTLFAAENISKQNFVEKKFGTIEYTSAEESYPVQSEFLGNGVPFEPCCKNVWGELKSEIKQKLETFSFPTEESWLIASYSCSKPHAGAEQAWDCKSQVFLDARSKEAPFVGGKSLVKGNFDEVRVSDKQPIFATVRYNCCDKPEAWTVYNFKGKKLCATAELTEKNRDWKEEKGSLIFPDNHLTEDSVKCFGKKTEIVKVGMRPLKK